MTISAALDLYLRQQADALVELLGYRYDFGTWSKNRLIGQRCSSMGQVDEKPTIRQSGEKRVVRTHLAFTTCPIQIELLLERHQLKFVILGCSRGEVRPYLSDRNKGR